MTAAALLDRVEKVRTRGPGQWSARCPAHPDNAPSLSVRELSDGVVLLHCFAGCTPDAIVAAAGLDLTDLFPPTTHCAPPLRRRALITASQALEVLEFEAQLVAVAALNVANGHSLTPDDLERLTTAASRISAIAQEVTA